jgi:hypothetical protein
MTSYNFGEIVLIGFPHTDLQGESKRPAIVLCDSRRSLIFTMIGSIINIIIGGITND